MGCGHPATREECDEIFNRSAEVELRTRVPPITDPKQIEEVTAELRQKKADEIIARCVGKRLKDSALECVRKATTTAAIEECID